MIKKAFNKKRYFTLLELLGVLVISAILLAVTLRMGNQSSVKSNASIIGSHLRLAQAEAVSRNIHVAAIISRSEEGYEQIGIYRWYVTIHEPERLFIDQSWLDSQGGDLEGVQVSDCEWVDISSQCANAGMSQEEADFFRRYAAIKGHTPKKLTGSPIIRDGAASSTSASTREYFVFLYLPNGTPDFSHSDAVSSVVVGEESSPAEMTVGVSPYSGHVTYK